MGRHLGQTIFTITAIITLLFGIVALSLQAQNTIPVSGRVTDFEGCPADSCEIVVVRADFSTAYAARSDKDGY